MDLKKVAAASIVALALTSGAACGSKVKGQTAASTTTRGTEATTTVASDTSSDTSDTSSDTSDTGSTFSGNLKDKLLKPSEVPGSFQYDGSVTDSDGTTDSADGQSEVSCDGKAATSLNAGFKEEASASFKPDTAEFPSVTENLAHDSRSKVDATYHLFTSTFAGCSKIEMTDSGDGISGTIAPFGVGRHGDASDAYLMSLTSQGVPVKLVFAIARKGSYIVNLVVSSPKAPKAADVDAILAAAVEKM